MSLEYAVAYRNQLFDTSRAPCRYAGTTRSWTWVTPASAYASGRSTTAMLVPPQVHHAGVGPGHAPGTPDVRRDVDPRNRLIVNISPRAEDSPKDHMRLIFRRR
jgi:hypothetical protein